MPFAKKIIEKSNEVPESGWRTIPEERLINVAPVERWVLQRTTAWLLAGSSVIKRGTACKSYVKRRLSSTSAVFLIIGNAVNAVEPVLPYELQRRVSAAETRIKSALLSTWKNFTEFYNNTLIIIGSRDEINFSETNFQRFDLDRES